MSIWDDVAELKRRVKDLEGVLASVQPERILHERWIDGRRQLSSLPSELADTFGRARRASERRNRLGGYRSSTKPEGTPAVDYHDIEHGPYGGSQAPARPRAGHEWARDEGGKPQP